MKGHGVLGPSIAVNPSASGSWCRSSLLCCRPLEGDTGASSDSSLYKVGVGALSDQAFVFFGDGGPLTPSKTKARLGNFCREGGLVGCSSRRCREAVAGLLTGDGGGESVSVDSVSRWVGYAPFCLDGGLCFLASARVPSGSDRGAVGPARRRRTFAFVTAAFGGVAGCAADRRDLPAGL